MSEYLKELCRTCLCSGGEMFPLFNADVSMVAAGFPIAADVMKMFTSIPLTDTDNFPDHICGVCLDEIQRAYIFKQKCKKSEKILNQLKGVNIKVKKLKDISNRNENDGENNDRKFQYDIKKEPIEIINDYEDLNRMSLTSQFDSVAHKSSEFQATFKSEPELIIEDCDDYKTKEDDEQFGCLSCGRESQSLAMYLDHIVSDHITGNLCNICNEEIDGSKFEHSTKHLPSNNCDELFYTHTSKYFNKLNHKESPDRNENRIREETVSIEFMDEEFIEHSSDHSHSLLSTKPKFQCKFCCKSLTRKRNLDKHLRVHTGEKPFECKLCLEKFREKHFLRYHVCSKICAYSEELKRRKLKCKICFEKFLNKRSLTEHFRMQHRKVPITLKSKNRCSVCSIKFTRISYLQIHMRLHSDDTLFQCESCSEQFRYQKLLRIHMVTMHTDKLSDGEPKYQCYICSKIFTFNNHLTNHMNMHRSEKSFECKLCSAKFWHSSLLMSHMQMDHTKLSYGDEPNYRCSDCSKIFNSNEHLMKHMIEHTDNKPVQSELCSEKSDLLMNYSETELQNESLGFKPKYQCGNCSIIFVNNKHLITHMRIHSAEKPFQCELCLEKFYQNSFQCHMKTVHSEKLTGAKPKYQCNMCSKFFAYNQELNRHMLSHTGEKPLQCEICSHKFRYKSNLVRHMKRRHSTGMNLSEPKNKTRMTLPEQKYECEICSKICRCKNDLNIHMSIHMQKNLFECDVCSEKFKQKRSLACHMKLRHCDQLPEDRPKHKCNVCLKIFDYSKDLIIHMRCHTSETYKKCELCPKKYGSNASLVRHMRTKHAKNLIDPELKYKCNDCLETFTCDKDLFSHICSHSGETTLLCKVCATKFEDKGSLLRHMVTHYQKESMEPERNYQCDLCSKRFSGQINLLRHVATHNNKKSFPCDLCTACFKQQRSLRFHMEVKHPEALPDHKPPKHQCNICSKILFSNRHLNRHMLSHTGEKPYQCELCAKKFRYKHTFLRHMEVEHAEELNSSKELP